MSLLDFLNNHGKKILPVIAPAVSFLSPMNVEANQASLKESVPGISANYVSPSLQYFQDRCEGTDDEKRMLKSLLSDLYQYPEGKEVIDKMDKRTSFGIGQPTGGGAGLDPKTGRIGLALTSRKDMTDKNATEYKNTLVTLYHEAIHAKQAANGQVPSIQEGITGTDYARNYKMLEVETFAKELPFADKVYGAVLPQEMDDWKKAELETFRAYEADFQKKNPNASADKAKEQAVSKMVEDLWTAPERLDMKTPVLKQKSMYDESLIAWHDQRTSEALNVYEREKRAADGKVVKNKQKAEAQMKKTADEIGSRMPMADWTRKLSLEGMRASGAPTEQQLESAREKFVSDMAKASAEKKPSKAKKLEKRAVKNYKEVKSQYDYMESLRLKASDFFKNEDKQTMPVLQTNQGEVKSTQSPSNQKTTAMSTAVSSLKSSQR